MDIRRYNVWWIQLMYQNFPAGSFCLIVKEACSLALFWWNIMWFQLTNPRCFLCCLQLVLLGAVLAGINCLIFLKELIIEDSLPVPPYIQHHILWLKTGLWYSWWWFISLAAWPFCSTLLCSIYFSSPITICF